jgi:hypothetical protein
VTSLELPALRGDDPLGFLAALGTLRLVRGGLGLDANLSFADGPVPVAHLDVGADIDLAELAANLEELARRTYDEGRLLVGIDGDFPPRKEGTKGGDPARISPDEGRLWSRVANKKASEGQEHLARWLLALYSSRAVDDKGRLVMTPFYAPSGQMTLAGSLAEPLRIVATEPGHLAAAFTRWRRVAGFTGANLDFRALRDAGVEPTGKPANRGAPGTTWLALEGLAVGRTGERSDAVPAVLWQRRIAAERGHRAIAMVWPTWVPHLDLDAVRVLLEHPALRIGAAVASERRALGVTAIWRAERAALSNSDGPLMAAQRMWPDG